ncbi:murein biosynthesis integral membrane protein MurJ [Halobacillus salinus]|uniref:murein biosynthesis integral membrane protein MurJ n=1 Tax=Halobacillus salinus TaxID=192814 RepID=UPI0009A89D58|nr:murein biosynthesis integral membrane protein MurJ [Halobacillus salinus]
MKRNLGIASILFLLATLVLKVSGLGRDVVLAYYFGDGEAAGAFLAAFTIPNMLFLFFSIGMKNSFVPSYIEAEQQGQGRHHMNQVFTGTFWISLLITILGAGTAGVVIPLLYPEFSPETEQIAVITTVIFFISVLFVALNSVLEAYFDSQKRFALAVLTQVIVVAFSVLGPVFFAEELGVYSMAYGYLIGAILSLLVKVFLLWSRQFPRLKARLDFKEVKDFYIVFVPVALTVAVGQINLTVDNVFAGYFGAGTISYINYARHLVQFPQAMIGMTIGMIIFPLLSKAAADGSQKLFKRGIEQGMNTMFFILAPALSGMMFLMPEIVEVLFERGQFSGEASEATTYVAYYYAGSVFFFSLHNVINKGFYSLKKGHLILMIGGVAIVLNAVFNYVFTQWMGYLGIPLASSVMGGVYVGGSFLLLLKLIGGLNLKFIAVEYGKILVATGAMVAGLLLLGPLFSSWAPLLFIVVISLIGAIIYTVVILALRTHTTTVIIDKFRGR